MHIVDSEGEVLARLKGALGHTTNNVAEYEGLLAGLSYAVTHGHRDVRLRSDSQLLIRQMKGEYRVKHPGLQPLYQRAQRLVSQLGRVVFEHVRREENPYADKLANEAMDEAAGKKKPQSVGA